MLQRRYGVPGPLKYDCGVLLFGVFASSLALIVRSIGILFHVFIFKDIDPKYIPIISIVTLSFLMTTSVSELVQPGGWFLYC